jgi:hypothetical protein
MNEVSRTPEPPQQVYRLYGAIMHLVQNWEQALSMIWWHASLTGNDGEAETEASQKAVLRLQHAFQKVTASQARKELGDNLPAEIADGVAALVSDRNRLAHRFLREQQLRGRFKSGTMTWMEQAGVRLEASMKQIQDHVNSFEDYKGPVRSHWPQLAQDLADRLLAGELIDLDQALQKSHEPD